MKTTITITLPNQGELTRRRLYDLQYVHAHNKIDIMDVDSKLRIAKEIETIELPSLYESVKYYRDGIPQPDKPWMTSDQFLAVMNKIKHWEQLLEWLYEFQFDIPLDMEV